LRPFTRRASSDDRRYCEELRQRQQQRIKTQKAPDGSLMPRVSASRQAKKGRIKREMFAKLRTNRFMKASGNDSAAVVEFTGKVSALRGCISSASKILPCSVAP
jgi:phage virion morphogenesis protein